MRICRGIPALLEGERALTIGSFDGLHMGHQALVRQTTSCADRLGLHAALLSFHPHPRAYFRPEQAPSRVLPWRDRLMALDALGLQEVFILKFNAALASLTAEHFVTDVLLRKLKMRALMVGQDFRFGQKRAGDVDLLHRMSRTHGFEFTPMPIVESAGQRSSSSSLRTAIEQGDLAQVRTLLKGPYLLSARVSHGQQLGRTLGFPTLNLRMPEDLAARGIYAVWVHGLSPRPLAGVASLGRRPTVEDAGRLLLEVHVLDWSGNAYGHCVRIELAQHLRGEEKFSDLALMTQQMHRDLRQAREFLSSNPSLLLGHTP
ncbi:MAG: hypothetical protein RL320_841 [Pseudomonadota bacterium]